ncbi:MAG: cytochrome c3 family protein [Myxococcales bacterium]|nr:cytochrome c3 family protein [Polyangiaceae bacterium]MDW8249137.1 cytochrome c3 family protein [Myxococcales bacterium]
MQIFPRWTNKLPALIAIAVALGGPGLIFVIWYYFSPRHTDVGYQPKQPVPYSHKLHAGDLGIDCRYCHVGVEKSAIAMVPPTQACMNCHSQVKKESAALAPIRQSWEDGSPIEWVRIHKVPDYAFFDHSAHLAAGVGCSSCHGRVDQMVKMRQDQPLSMGWCLDCHRNPLPHLRPKDKVTQMDWVLRSPEEVRNDPRVNANVNPPQNCTGCHR